MQAREQGGATLAALLCCGKPCARELPACGHICGATCHPGRCPGAGSCTQEVTVRAPLEMPSWLEDTLDAMYCAANDAVSPVSVSTSASDSTKGFGLESMRAVTRRCRLKEPRLLASGCHAGNHVKQ